MSDFAKVWEVLEVFPRYTLFQKIALIAGIPILIYWLYLVTAGRPPAVAYSLELSFSHRITSTGPLLADGNLIIMMDISNLSKPGAELHNISGEVWTRKKYVIQQPFAPVRQFDDSVYYDFAIPFLYKNSATIWEWVFTPPQAGEEIPLGYRIVASEVDWQSGSWSVVNEKGQIRLKNNAKTK